MAKLDGRQLGAWQIITLQFDLWNLPARELNGHVITLFCLNMKNLHIHKTIKLNGKNSTLCFRQQSC